MFNKLKLKLLPVTLYYITGQFICNKKSKIISTGQFTTAKPPSEIKSYKHIAPFSQVLSTTVFSAIIFLVFKEMNTINAGKLKPFTFLESTLDAEPTYQKYRCVVIKTSALIRFT
jgi:hypothetical protein